MDKSKAKVIARQKRVRRIRKKITGTPERPRMRVFKSAKHIYAQVIDDTKGHTLAAVSTLDKTIATDGSKCELAMRVGKKIAELSQAVGIDTVTFDRGGYIYHGRVKALADGAREGGLKL